jgi:hypothetical protein
MSAMDTMDRNQAIGVMLASFPASQSQGQLVALAYLMAVEDASDYAIRAAAKEFIKGTIEAHDKRFAPSTAQFASRCDLHERNIARAVEYVAKHPEKLGTVEAPEAYHAEMRRRIAALPSLVAFRADDPERDVA